MKFNDIYREGDLTKVLIPISIGAALMALGQNLFSMPSGLLSGGIAGIALIANYSLGISSGLVYFVLNIPMVILALRKLSIRFTVQSFLSVLVFTLVQITTSRWIGILKIDDYMLNSIFSGVLRGAGAGLIYRVGASAMGTDVLGAITQKEFNISISSLNMMLDIVILLASSVMYGFPIVLYTIIGQFISSNLADRIMQGIGERKNVTIVTRKYTEMTEEIQKRLDRGVTLLDAEGGYNKDKIKVIFTVVNNRQIAQIRGIMKNVDENAFMTITDSSEVKGKGFRSLH